MANGFFFIFGRNWALERRGNWELESQFRGERERAFFFSFNTTYLLTNK